MVQPQRSTRVEMHLNNLEYFLNKNNELDQIQRILNPMICKTINFTKLEYIRDVLVQTFDENAASAYTQMIKNLPVLSAYSISCGIKNLYKNNWQYNPDLMNTICIEKRSEQRLSVECMPANEFDRQLFLSCHK